MKDKNLLVMAVPSVFVRSTAQKMKPFCKEGQLIVDVAKGIEENTLDTMTQIIKEELPMAETAVLSGPSHAEEVSRGLPTLCVAGSRKKNVAEYVQSTFISPVFRVYTSPDVLGIETGAALKNVVALAAGIADGLGYGDNAKAALITRGMAEIARLGIAMGGKYQTYTGLSGIGDLIVTCASMHSRNRRAGILIGKGYTMEEAMKEVQMVVEGVYSAKAARAHHFIQTLPGGYQMELNEDASNVSQGQKQLLTIARAILADNKILILDEATSSVDTRTEIEIQKAMDNLMKGRTSFVIAHRLSTIRDADLILVMKDGDIIEQGTHDALLKQNGFYAELYNSQFEEAS